MIRRLFVGKRVEVGHAADVPTALLGLVCSCLKTYVLLVITLKIFGMFILNERTSLKNNSSFSLSSNYCENLLNRM